MFMHKKGNVHSKYLHCPWTDFAKILKTDSWKPKNEDDLTQKFKTIWPKK